MHETKSKWFKKVLRATLCFLVVCGSLSAMLFVPNKEEETPQVPIEKELCVYSAPLQVSPTPTPISIEEEPAEPEADLNPYMHEAYSGSISDILFSPCQFVVGDYYGSVQMEAVDAALAGHPALDLNTDVVYFSTGSLTYGSYYKTIGDHVFRTYI